MGISYYLENKFLNYVLRNTAFSSGSSNWVALYTSDPTRSDTGTEVTGGGYARASCSGSPPYSAPLFGVANPTSASNIYKIVFPTSTADWGTITHFGIRDASAGGNLLYFGQITSGSGLIESDNTLSIMPGNLVLSQYGSYYLMAALFNHVLNNVSYTTPGSSLYGTLYSTMPSLGNTGGVEISGSIGYSRQQITNWVSPTSGSTYNSGSITFCSDALENWVNSVVGMVLRDASVGGNYLYGFNISGSLSQVQKYDKFVLNEGDIQLLLDVALGGNTT
jgi:hypothetical protein